jgi:tape measure domain-containing protein
MASVAALNVRIGGDIKALEKSLRDAERAVRTAGARLSNIGNELSMKLSLPLLAFGAAAIKSAGEIEAIEKAMQATFQGAGRSIEEANAELVALRKAAEAPGLDFEQAVKASLRLQGVGFSAEKARNTIIQLANAISTTGGTAENLNGVTVQFAQIISKGKILTSDLNVIKENMPGLAKIMKETFGTTSAEDLRALGVSGQEFVEKITAAMQKLPRVEGGISNAIVNAGVAIKMFLADVGESLNKTFNVTGKLEAFSKFLSDLGEKFSGMSEGTQRAIAAVGVFALALGPMLKVGQLGILAYGRWTAIMGAWDKAVLSAKVTSSSAALEFIKMDRAARFTAIGAAIGVVLALAAAYAVLREDTSAAAQAARAVEDVNKKAAESILFSKQSVDVLVKAYANEKTSLEGRKNILKQLNDIAPDYFGQIKTGTGDIEAITLAQGRYNAELLRTARVTAAKEKLVEIESKLLEIDEKRGDLSYGDKFAMGLVGINNTTDALKKQKTVLDQQAAPLLKQREYLSAIAQEDAVVTANTKKLTDGLKDNTDKTDKNATAVDKQAKAYRELDKAQRVAARQADEAAARKARAMGNFAPLPTNATPGVSRETKDTVKTQDIKTDPTFAQTKIIEAAKAMANMTIVLDAFKQGSASFGEVWDVVSSQIQSSIERLSLTFDNLGKVMQVALFGATAAAKDYADKGGSSFQEMGKAALAGGAKVVRSYIMQGVAASVSKALQSVPFPFNLIAGGVAGAAAGVLFNKLLNALKIPAMAKGGISGGGMTLVGELGPELVNLPRGAAVTPNNKLSSMLGGASNVNVFGTFRVQGADLVLVIDEQRRRENRRR